MKKTELIVNIILIAVGIIGGVSFFIFDLKDLSLILFSIALACILYQFLGGIGENNNFNLGAIKFGGSAAILIGFMFFLKKVVFVPDPQELNLNIEPKNWIPISVESGKTINVEISNNKDCFTYPDSNSIDVRKNHNFQVEESENGQFLINTIDNKHEIIGSFDIKSLNSCNLFNNLKVNDEEKRIQVFRLYPDIEDKNSTNDISELDLPFEIRVFNGSRFSVFIEEGDSTKVILKNLEIVTKTAYIIPISNNQSYILFLEQASNKIDERFPNRYSKWLVKKIDHQLLSDSNI